MTIRAETETSAAATRRGPLDATAGATPVVAVIFGGLGNQMFQYAVGRAVSLRLGLPLALDIKWYLNGRTSPHRPYGLDAFRLPATTIPERPPPPMSRPRRFIERVAGRVRRLAGLGPTAAGPAPSPKYVGEPHWHYWPGIEQVDGPVRLQGYWQAPRYFADVADTIRADFTFPRLPAGASRDLAAKIRSARNPVAVHVRRGDYVSNPRTANFHGGCCPPEYYARAIERLVVETGALDLFLFGDDPDWLRSNFDFRGQSAVLVDVSSHREAAWHDIHLMSLAKHHVIANSSFSWWGAWLAGPGGRVIAPRRWFNVNPPGVVRTGDHLPEAWVAL